MKRILAFFGGILNVFFTGGKYGPYIEGKLCPKCHVNRIKLHKKCCRACYDKYFK
jgi:hypothetical protein